MGGNVTDYLGSSEQARFAGALNRHVLPCRGEQRKAVCSQPKEEGQQAAEKAGGDTRSLFWWLSSPAGDPSCLASECLLPNLTLQHT